MCLIGSSVSPRSRRAWTTPGDFGAATALSVILALILGVVSALYYFLASVVVPLSRPIIGVLALLTFVNAYKDFLWPLLVLRRQEMQTVSVALTHLSVYADVAQIMAALFVAVLVPIALFIIFQRQFLSGISAAGGIKG